MNANTSRIDPEPTHDEVALTAFLAWEKEGRPPGCEQAYWLRAECELRSLKQKRADAGAKSWPLRPSTSREPDANGKQKMATNMKRTTTVKTESAKATSPRRARTAVKSKR